MVEAGAVLKRCWRPELQVALAQTCAARSEMSAAGLKAIIANRVYLGGARAGRFVKPNAHRRLVDETLWIAANRKDFALASPRTVVVGRCLGMDYFAATHAGADSCAQAAGIGTANATSTTAVLRRVPVESPLALQEWKATS